MEAEAEAAAEVGHVEEAGACVEWRRKEGREEQECDVASVRVSLGRLDPQLDDPPYFGFRYDMAEGMKGRRVREREREVLQRDGRRKKVCDKK